MTENRLNKPLLPLLSFLLLQLCGQTAAGFAGRMGGINLFTIISYFCLLSRGLVWILILKRLPLTVAYPFTGAIYLLILPLSIFLFGESPDWSRFAGAALIFAGIAVSSSGTDKTNG